MELCRLKRLKHVLRTVKIELRNGRLQAVINWTKEREMEESKLLPVAGSGRLTYLKLVLSSTHTETLAMNSAFLHASNQDVKLVL